MGAVAARMVVLQLNPPPDVHRSALPEVEHDGTASALGVVAVNAPTTVLADCDARLDSGSDVGAAPA